MRQIAIDYPISRTGVRRRLIAHQKQKGGAKIPLVWEETRLTKIESNVKRIRLSTSGKNPSTKNQLLSGKIKINDKIYNSVLEAVSDLEISKVTISRRLADENFPAYLYLKSDGDVISKADYKENFFKKQATYTINGEEFASMSAVIERFNVSKHAVLRRCRSTELLYSGWIRNIRGEKANSSDSNSLEGAYSEDENGYSGDEE